MISFYIQYQFYEQFVGFKKNDDEFYLSFM
jgi:hypothetical protein